MTAPYHPPSISAQSSSASLRSASPSHPLPAHPNRHFLQNSSNTNDYFPPNQISASNSNKKKHVCHICSKAFTTSGHLSRHARIHTGERNHKCPFPGCDTRCSRQDNLQQHYRIHLTPGSRRNSASSRSQVLSGTKKHVRALPSAPAPPSDSSPPTTPPALELAVIPRVYSASEPSPPLSAMSYPSVREYVKQDYQDAVTPSHYFDPRGSPHRAFDAGRPSAAEELLSPTCPSVVIHGLRRDSCDNASGNDHASFPPQNHIYVPPSGALVMTGPHAINSMTNTASYTTYGTYVPSTHPPPNHAPPTQSSNAPMRVDVSLAQPQPRDDARYMQGQLSGAGVPSNQPHISPVTSSDSPSPVSSLSLSSHSSEHSPSLYQKHHYTMAIASDLTYPLRGPPQPTQIQVTPSEVYHSSDLVPTQETYNRGSTSLPWQNPLSTRGISAMHGHGGSGFVL